MNSTKRNILPGEEVQLQNEETKPVEPQENLMNYNFPGLGSVKAKNLAHAQELAREKWPEYFEKIEKDYEEKMKAKAEKEAQEEE